MSSLGLGNVQRIKYFTTHGGNLRLDRYLSQKELLRCYINIVTGGMLKRTAVSVAMSDFSNPFANEPHFQFLTSNTYLPDVGGYAAERRQHVMEPHVRLYQV